MNITADLDTFAQPEAPRLPESIAVSGAMLFAGDGVAAVVVLILCALAHAAIGAFFVLASTLIVAALIGRYRESIAVYPHDEWYAACAVAIPGAIAGVAFDLALNFSVIAAIVSALIWTLAAGGIGMMLHRARRRGISYIAAANHVSIKPRTTSWDFQQTIIRAFDAAASFIALIVLSPVFAAIAVAIAVDDGLPLIFVQLRSGRGEIDFHMYKFRTMRVNSGTQWVQAGDERITRVGAFLRKTSLDELPQLWNVLRGDMSLVGPRPEMIEYAERFSQQHQFYSQRHMIRPGITGWAQLYLPRHLQPEDAPTVMQYDLFYVEICGLYAYWYCIAKTTVEIFRHRAL
jgi:lipopolysaccharide/colanic/teichoic acid biosynthesis glycosyltransferase